MSEFKIGDDVVCVNNALNEHLLVLGKTYTVVDVRQGICRVDGLPYNWFMSRFKLASEIEDSATPTEVMVEISQNEYDEMQDRIELLESLLVDANNRIASLEYSLGGVNKVVANFSRLTYLVSDNLHVADLIDAKWGDDVVDKIRDYLLKAVNNK